MARLRIARTLLAVLACVWLSPALADDHPIEAELQRCMDTVSGMSTHGMRACLDTANTAWDKELNRVWSELMGALGTPAKAALRASQRKWIAFRDAEIAALDLAYGAMDGTMYQVMHADAVTQLTSDRVRQLDSLLEAQRM
jgi:uncharacterized protein YecT (DUF1311 family)